MVEYWTIQAGDRMTESLEAQLQATLNMIPAYTWYATRSGGLIFVNGRAADYGGLPSEHPLRHGTDTSAAWDSHIAGSRGGVDQQAEVTPCHTALSKF